MTPDQLIVLKNFIREVAQYEAARVTDEEASWQSERQAEKDLDEAFASAEPPA